MKWKLLACSFLFCLSTNAWAQVPDPDSELGEEMQTLVKNYVTEHPEVAIDDAITRLAVQTEILQPMEDLEQEFAGRFTAISIQQEPDQHILLELKGSGHVNSRSLRTASGTARIVIEAGHKHTQEEFYAIVNKHRDLLYGAIPGIVGTMGLPGEDLLVIHITGDQAKAQELKTIVKKLERVLDISLSLRPNMSKSLNMEHIDRGAVLILAR